MAPRLGSLAGRSVGERKEPAPDVRVERAVRTPQFWLLWGVLFFTASATFGMLAMAPFMIRFSFPFTVADREAGGFNAFLFLVIVAGSLIWSVVAEAIGRPRTFRISLAIAVVFAGLLPTLTAVGSFLPFVIASALVVSVRGGIFAATPAMLRDTFGVMHIAAIQGRLLSAFCAGAFAGTAIAGLIVNRDFPYAVPNAQLYALPTYTMTGFFAVAFILNWLISPVHPRHHDKPLSGFRG